jgi:hypothetical protein
MKPPAGGDLRVAARAFADQVRDVIASGLPPHQQPVE